MKRVAWAVLVSCLAGLFVIFGLITSFSFALVAFGFVACWLGLAWAGSILASS